MKLQRGHALTFDGVDDYVDCGQSKSLDLRGPMSIEAWVNRDAVQAGEAGVIMKTFNSYGFTFWADVCSFYISAGANRLDVGPWTPDEWHHVVFTFDGKEMKGYLDFFSSAGRKASRKSRYPRISPAARLSIGMLPKKPPYKRDMPFKGLIDDVRIYSRPLSEQEIIAHYWAGAWRRGEPREMELTPHFYLDEGEILVRLNLRGVMPLTEDARVTVAVGRPGEKASQTTIVKPIPQSAECELPFRVADLPPGEYQIRAVAENDAGVRSEKRIPFRYPRPPVKVASPEERTLPPLAPPREPLPYGFKLHEGGGFEMTLKGVGYPVESTFSYPHGGNNGLVASQTPDAAGEESWKVTVDRIGADEYEVHARGGHYAVNRHIHLRPNHIRIRDTIRNLTGEDIGIIIRNRMNTEGKKFDTFYVNGVRRTKGWWRTIPLTKGRRQSRMMGAGRAMTGRFREQRNGPQSPSRSAFRQDVRARFRRVQPLSEV